MALIKKVSAVVCGLFLAHLLHSLAGVSHHACTGGANLMRNLPPNVRFAGYIEGHEKAALIAGAHGLIMPSFAEGFGIPIIEALAANTPVLCSDIPVFREVAGELADYFDPFSTDSICASVARALSHQEEWRRRIRERRDELAQRFGHQTQARDFLAHHAPAENAITAAKSHHRPARPGCSLPRQPNELSGWAMAAAKPAAAWRITRESRFN